jgi:uncharacterized protein
MKQHNAKFEIKNLRENGTFTGLAAVYSNVDLGGDVIEPGAFTRTLADKEGEVPILWQHDRNEPIGLGKVRDGRKGLEIEGKLVLEVAKAQEAYALLRDKALRGLSIGYDVVKEEVRNGVRYLKEIRLWEVSLVTFPMNQLALVEGVKMSEAELKATIARIVEYAKGDEEYRQKVLDACAELTVVQGNQPDIQKVFEEFDIYKGKLQ